MMRRFTVPGPVVAGETQYCGGERRDAVRYRVVRVLADFGDEALVVSEKVTGTYTGNHVTHRLLLGGA